MTDELSPQARAFLELAQQDSEIEATPEDRARVSKALAATLAAGAGAAVGSAALAKASGSSGLFGFFASAGAGAKGVMLVLAVGGAVAVGGQLMTEPRPAEPIQSSSGSAGSGGGGSLATGSQGSQRVEPEDGVEIVAPETVVPEMPVEPELTEHAAETVPASEETADSVPVQAVRRRVPAPAEDQRESGEESAASGGGSVLQQEPEGPSALEDDGANEEMSAPGLAEELALLRQAQAARTRGDTRAAMALLDEHATRFPTGTFVAEREGSRALIRCAAPGRSNAERADIGQRFVRRFATSPLRRRVEQACQPAPSGETPSGQD